MQHLGSAARRDLDDPGVVVLLVREVHERPALAHARPGRNVDVVEVRDVGPLVAGDALPLLPLLVRGLSTADASVLRWLGHPYFTPSLSGPSRRRSTTGQ